MSTSANLSSGTAHGCEACPLVTDRRAFLRQTALLVAGTLAATGLSPSAAFASGARYIAPLATRGSQRRYDLPSVDGVAIDSANDVILARWQGHVYAFSLLCPHRGTRLVWHADESRVFCPKHKARFRADGAHDSGRSTRSLDRYALHLEGGAVVVELDTLYRVDVNPAGWNAAVIAI
jgi:nitrite reductase/ring-hydroxylating ferredoxin subunit